MGGKEGLDLSAPQIVGGALAAATAAVAASFLGVTGTIVGAALASAATTVGNAVYTHYLHRTRDRLKQAHALVVGREDEKLLGERAEDGAAGEEGLAAAVHATVRDHGPADLAPSMDDAVPLNPDTAEKPWLRTEGGHRPLALTMIVAAVVMFALSMGGILAFELLSGKPLAATVHGRDGSGTSWGGTVDDASTPSPSPSTRETPATGTSAAPEETPTPSSAPGDSGSSPTSNPSGSASQAPRPTSGQSGQPSSAPEGTDVPPGTDSGAGDDEDTGDGQGTGDGQDTGNGGGTDDAEGTGGAGVQPSTTSR